MFVHGNVYAFNRSCYPLRAGCPGSETPLSTAEKGVELSNLSKQHSIVHMLLMNANGDMYQIADKYLQFDAPPSDLLEDIPNDDGYFFELSNNATTQKDSGSSSSNKKQGSDKSHRESEREREERARAEREQLAEHERYERDHKEHHEEQRQLPPYRWKRSEARKRIASKAAARKHHAQQRGVVPDSVTGVTTETKQVTEAEQQLADTATVTESEELTGRTSRR